MSIRIMTWVWEHGPTDPTERLVMLALADYSDDQGISYPSMISIGEKACVTDRGARGIVRRLEAQGWLQIRTGGGRGGKNVYRITCVKPGTESRVSAENPERKAAFSADKPGTTNPEYETRNTENPEADDTKPGTRLHKTRNQGSAEPSGTVKEPSAKLRAAAPGKVSERALSMRAVIVEALGIDSTGLDVRARPIVKGLTGSEVEASLAAWAEATKLDDRQIALAIGATIARERAKNPRWLPRSLGYFDPGIADYASRLRPGGSVHPLDGMAPAEPALTDPADIAVRADIDRRWAENAADPGADGFAARRAALMAEVVALRERAVARAA